MTIAFILAEFKMYITLRKKRMMCCLFCLHVRHFEVALFSPGKILFPNPNVRIIKTAQINCVESSGQGGRSRERRKWSFDKKCKVQRNKCFVIGQRRN